MRYRQVKKSSRVIRSYIIAVTYYDRNFRVNVNKSHAIFVPILLPYILPYYGTSEAYIECDEISKSRIRSFVKIRVRRTLRVVAHSISRQQRHVYSCQAIRVYASILTAFRVFTFGINIDQHLLRLNSLKYTLRCDTTLGK